MEEEDKCIQNGRGEWEIDGYLPYIRTAVLYRISFVIIGER